MEKKKLLKYVVMGSIIGFSTQVYSAACPEVPQVVKNIPTINYYKDHSNNVIDPIKRAQNKKITANVENFVIKVSRLSDRYIIDSDIASARCTIDWLQNWAKSGGLSGKMGSYQGRYIKNSAVGGLALAYLKVKPEAQKEQRVVIENWLISLANDSLKFAKSDRVRGSRINYVGMSSMAVGIATNNKHLIDSARHIYNNSLHNIAKDGSIAGELKKGSRALSYHNYALAPLVMMAEMSKAVGENWYANEDYKIKKLAELVLYALRDPHWFVVKTHQDQVIPQGNSLAWVEYYEKIATYRDQVDYLLAYKPFIDSYWGGNVTALAGVEFFSHLNEHGGNSRLNKSKK